jgi:ankyrin repeat protein
MDTTQYDGKDGPEASLHAAGEEGKIDVVKSLLVQGINVNGRNASIHPFDNAAAKGDVDVVHFLLERGAEVDSRDMWGWLHGE